MSTPAALLYETHARAGDLAQLLSTNHRFHLVRLETGAALHTHKGVIYHDDLIGLPWGTQVYSHLGASFYLLRPSLADLLRETRRNTQIMFPKDIGFVLISMSIGPGQTVLEAGTGSGALTTALAFAVGREGRVISYERRGEMQHLARRNLRRVGLAERVTFKLRDIGEGFDEREVDALFLDVPNPEDYIPQVRRTLKTGGFFGALVPTTNQVSRLAATLQEHHFAFIDICEILLRYYKAVPERLRPTDRMVAHTGYLIFARSVIPTQPPEAAAPPVAEEEA